MKVIIPDAITDAVITSTNISEDDYAEWDVAATYAVADRVIILATHRIYESLIAANTGNDPTLEDQESPINWLDVSATNRWKPFDQIVTSQAVNAGLIEYEFTTTNIVNSVAFFGVEAETIQVIATSASDGVVYDKTITMQNNSAVYDWFTWFFEPIVNRSKAVFHGLPNYFDAVITVKVAVSSGDAKVGQIVLGRVRRIGETEFGTTVGFRDYSTKKTNIYGDQIIVKRRYANVVDFDIAIRTSDAEMVNEFLAGYRTDRLVWIGSSDINHGVLVYGYYRDTAILLESPSISRVNIHVED